MNGERIEELLLKLLEDMAEVKAKLDAIEKQQLSQRIDKLEAECRVLTVDTNEVVVTRNYVIQSY